MLSRIFRCETGCHLWTGALAGTGYGSVRSNGKSRPAHIVAYEQANGPVPMGLELDHTCRVRSCVNPAHLEPVTRRENTRRGAVGSRTSCIHNHEYTKKNTRMTKAGHRQCRACARIKAQRRRDDN